MSICRWVSLVAVLLACARAPGAPDEKAALPRVAAFHCDVTPPPGEPLIWDVPLAKVEEPLLSKGVLLEDGPDRFVLCALDWCELCNGSDLLLRTRIAAAAGTDPSRVSIHSVHQHAAPYADAGAHRLLDGAPNPPLHLSDRFLDAVAERLAAAVTGAAGRLEAFDQVGTGRAAVDRVASTRRVPGEGGKVIVRYSAGAKDPALAAAPEGPIDPDIRTVTFARGGHPLVRLHYYATHPQTFCCDGRASSDFVGAAREALERKENVPQVYFTGCAGDVTAGKYNDESPQAREGLASRLLAGMEASIASTRFAAAGRLRWRSVPLVLPLRTDKGYTPDDLRARMMDRKGASGSRVYAGAMALSFIERADRPLSVSALRVGEVLFLSLPGEPMLEFQRYAQRTRPDRFVVAAGLSDCGPGYICTDQAYVEGGYEPTASNVAPGSEGLLKEAIRKSAEE